MAPESRRRSSVTEVEDDVEELEAEAPGSNGWHQAKQWSTAVLLGTVAKRGECGGRVCERATATAEAAMAEGSAAMRGGSKGGVGLVQGVGSGDLILPGGSVAARRTRWLDGNGGRGSGSSLSIASWRLGVTGNVGWAKSCALGPSALRGELLFSFYFLF